MTRARRLTEGKRLGLLMLFGLFTMMALAPQARAQENKLIEEPDIIIDVGGLACPFCAYGIEKRLKKIDGIDKLSVLLEEGKVQLKLKEGFTVSEERRQKAVADAGFEAKRIVFLNEDAQAQNE